ncbi:MAG: hypothetical protein AB7S36_04340 [Planctomycetota bacterium]
MMPSLPVRLPGRATRGMLWWRHMWRYALAHKPLCERFAPHVLRIGSVHVCRSCALMWTAAAASFGALLAIGATTGWLLALLPALAGPVVVLSVPALYDRWTRPMRDLLRALLGATVAMLALLWLQGALVAAAVATVSLLIARRLFVRQHRRRSLDACAGCPELDRRGVCSGFARQADAVRRLDEAIVARMQMHPAAIP